MPLGLKAKKIRGIVFDLDGTLVDSALDFDRMRAEIGLPGGAPVLESVERMPDGERKRRSLEILLRHEMEGAARARAIAGAVEFVDSLRERGVRVGVLTRNLREPSELSLKRSGFVLGPEGLYPILTRECAPPKPHPAGLTRIFSEWGLSPSCCAMIGDYKFDLLAGRAAGAFTVLYAPHERPDYADQADHVFSSYSALALEFHPLCD